VTLLSAWALAGLLLTVPLVLAHLRRRRPPLREVDSLLPWRELGHAAAPARRRFAAPVLPLLLALQLAALVVLVLSLARPAGGAEQPRASHVFVLDDSIWMQARDGNASRVQAAAAAVRSRLRELPRGERVSLVLATATPQVIYSGAAAGAGGALRALPAGEGAANLAAALRLAVGLGTRRGEQILLLRAPEDAPVAVSGSGAQFSQLVVGERFADQGLTGATARCGLPGAATCEVFAQVQNSGSATAADDVSALLDGAVAARQAVTVPAEGSAPVAFHAPAGARIELELAGHDALAADDRAFAVVPASTATTVTVVGSPSDARPLAAALASVPGVRLRLRTPSDYRAAEASESDLLVLDGWVPAGELPDAPALLLVDPPRLPGGQVLGGLSDSRVSGSEPSSPLLAGVDLLSLSIDAGAGRRMRLPGWMQSALWSPEGPLLAAGEHGGRRVAMLSFDPSLSDLPQLEAFPALIANLVAFGQEWAPAKATAGQALLYDSAPGTASLTVSSAAGGVQRLDSSAGAHALTLAAQGFATISARGRWGTRTRTLPVNVELPSATGRGRVPLALPAGEAGPRAESWPWLLAGALALLLAELLYVTRPAHAREALG
jgi:Ca-activated chloride channel family protein